jgi:RimJ/RimL family protein N-acetyltransferase
LLEGKTVDLKVEERDDIDFEVEYCNDIDFWGEFDPIVEQKSKSERMKQFDNPSNLAILAERKRFLIRKKDGTRMGIINHRLNQPYKTMEIVCFLIPSERGKGYGTEAIQLMIDYLFLSKDIVRIQAITNVRNKAAQRVLEKTGFRIEGTARRLLLVRGVWTDYYLHSILREEWKEPKILTKTA